MSPPVSLVIPGRNCGRTIGACLDAAVPLLEGTPLAEIVFVDDGSTDDTRSIAEARAPHVTVVPGNGTGPGAARNLGWRTAANPLVWFIDADCVTRPDALTLLLPHLDAHENVGAVGGSYDNLNERSLLACLIHEEIVERHRRMPHDVNFLASFNVLYKRDVLDEVDGFDERFLKAQDAELAYRVQEAGHRLRFELASRVGHDHPTRVWSYLRTQRQQGYWRAWLYITRRGRPGGDSYSGKLDHLQPPLAMLVLAALMVGPFTWIPPAALASLLFLATLPMTLRLVRSTGKLRYLAYAPLSFVRAFWRGIGLSMGTLTAMFNRAT